MEVGVDGIMAIMGDITTTSLAHVPLITAEERGVQRRLRGALMVEGIMEEEAGQTEVTETLAGIMEVQDITRDIMVMEDGTMGEEGASETVNALVHSNVAFCIMAISVLNHSIMDSMTLKYNLL